MLHGALTLLNRALREDARRRRAHLFRLFGSLLIFIFLIVAHASSGGVAAPGKHFFELITGLNVALIVLAGSSYFATSITEEKEQGTLGLLQLAGLSPLGLLLGKSTARLISALLIFLGQLPFAMLAITLGGITVRQILAADLALGAFLVMVANLGLLSSVIMPRSGSACTLLFLVLGAVMFGVPVLDSRLGILIESNDVSAEAPGVAAGQWVLSEIQRASLLTRLEQVFANGFDGSFMSRQVWVQTCVGGIAFLLSWGCFHRFTRYEDVAAPSRGWIPQRNLTWRMLVGRTWNWPLVWKDYHFMTGGHSLAILKLIAYPLILLTMWRYQIAAGVSADFPEAAGLLMLFIVAGESCFYASRIFHEEVKWGTLSSLALFPLSTSKMASHKLAGCLLGLAPAMIVLTGLVILVPSSMVQLFQESAAFWFLLFMQFLVLLHLTVLISLTVKWGALALAIGALLILNALLSLPFAVLFAGLSATYDDENAAIGPILYFGVGAIAILQTLIVIRIRTVAAR